MTTKVLIAQIFSIIGFVIIISSFQCKKNKNFFLMQGLGGFMFFLNFFLIGAYAGAFFNLTNLVRGLLFLKNDKKPWKLIITILLYTFCFAFSTILIWGDGFGILISALPYVALVIMSVLMWLGDGTCIRIYQFSIMSPAWIVHNIFNFSLGGILCESVTMVSVIVYFLRIFREKRKIKEIKENL